MGGTAIDDIISQGQDREPRPWPRRLAITAVIVVLAALIVNHLPHGGRPRHHRPAAAASPAPVNRAPAAIHPASPDGITGPTASWAASLRLPVAGPQPRWLWPATGRTEAIAGLPRARPGYLFTRIGGGWAVQQAPAISAAAGCADCAGPALPVYFLADRAQSASPVGVADKVAPADTAGAMWLTSYPIHADLSAAVGAAQEMSATGAPLGPRLRLPAGYAIDAATDRGLLLVPAVQGATPTYKLWNPTLGQVTGIFSGVIAASADEIAWAPPCVTRCVIRVLHLAPASQAGTRQAGTRQPQPRETEIRLPAFSSAANGAFSPDGTLLALELTFGNGGNGGGVATQLEVAPVASDHLTVVPGSWASSDALAGFGWPSDDDSLVAELSFLTKVQVASWHLGAGRLAVAVVRPGQNPGELIVG